MKNILLSSVIFALLMGCGPEGDAAPPQTENTANNGVVLTTEQTSSEGSATPPTPEIPAPTEGSSEENPSDNPNPAQTSNTIDFSPNDVSILFPPPSRQGDLSKLIRLTDFDADRVLPQSVFAKAIGISTSPAGTVKGTSRSIGFATPPQRQDWVISGIRIDPGAPGLSKNIFDVFGKSPQIRLIAQPVHENGNSVMVDDISLHLVYAFNTDDEKPGCRLHKTPDMDRFTQVVMDLKAIKDQFQTQHNIDSSGALRIHPAFETAGQEYRNALRDYLNEHLTQDTLFAVSIAGIPQRFEPWIFLAMNNHKDHGLVAIPSPATVQPQTDLSQAHFSQMLSFLDTPRIQPAPATRNMSPTDCDMNFPRSITAQADGQGTSTAQAFNGGGDITSISRVISDVSASHFFNTDCVSCHTETRKEIDAVSAPSQQSALTNQIAAQARIDPSVMPHGDWNVRVMGWAPQNKANNTPGAQATIARRAATETAEVVECFHSETWNSATDSCLP